MNITPELLFFKLDIMIYNLFILSEEVLREIPEQVTEYLVKAKIKIEKR